LFGFSEFRFGFSICSVMIDWILIKFSIRSHLGSTPIHWPLRSHSRK
jgi:hypothetical protein